MSTQETKKEVVEKEEGKKEPEKELESESESSSKDEKEIDYEALNQKEKERIGKPDPLKAKERFEKKKEEPVEYEDEEDKPITKRDLAEILGGFQKQSQEMSAIDIARRHTSSEAEAQAALTFWKTRVKTTGNLEEDVLFAIGGLNHRKIVAKNKELAAALHSRENASNDSASAFKDSPQSPSPKLSANDTKAYERAGFSFDTKDKVWKKKLPNGKFLVKDPRTKATRVL